VFSQTTANIWLSLVFSPAIDKEEIHLSGATMTFFATLLPALAL
jgi:hypothetical protein